MENLIDLQVKTLLKKFGAGNHKPGSGSAVALEGMLAAEMIRTVIDITKTRPAYKHLIKDLEIIIKEVESDIYPALTKLIQEDSIQFGKAIDARKARNAEVEDIEIKSKHAHDALEELKVATEIPVAIAKHCIRLAELGIYIFDTCFQSARGDSSVAINSALSAVSGCLPLCNPAGWGAKKSWAGMGEHGRRAGAYIWWSRGCEWLVIDATHGQTLRGLGLSAHPHPDDP